jgi:phosphatidate cytidylyltransferase
VINNFLQRSITGIVFVSAIVLSIIWQPIAFVLLFTPVTWLTVKELANLINSGNSQLQLRAQLIASAASLLFLSLSLLLLYYDIPSAIFGIVLFSFLSLMISELYSRKRNFILNFSVEFFSIAYIALPFTLLSYLGGGSFRNSGTEILLGFFIILWTYDSMAYTIGVLLGKHKIFPSISPKKSWEGFIGGLAFSAIAAYVLSFFYPVMSVYEWIIFALITGIFGTFGDLSESWIKRQLNIKDSGSILPGHGGLLDRFDAVFLAAPAIFAYLLILNDLTK